MRLDLLRMWVWPIVIGTLLGSSSGCRGKGKEPGASRAPAHKVVLEVDRMQGTPALQLDQQIGGRRVSLKELYKEAGIDVDVQYGESNLPRKEEVSLRDLHAMMGAYRSKTVPRDAMHIYLLEAVQEQDKPDTLGIMFDYGEQDADGLPREGFAVFAKPHEGLPSPAQELLLTAAHELAHSFNLHHSDWEGTAFRTGSSIEGYSSAQTVLWNLSERSKQHLRGHPNPEIWPGRGSAPFGRITAEHARRHQSVPDEGFDVVDAPALAAARAAPHQHQAAGTYDAAARAPAPETKTLKLRLEVPKRSYVLGEPVIVTVALHNLGTQTEYVLPLLDPQYQFLTMAIRQPGAAAFEPFRPAVLADARGAQLRPLAPGESLHEEARIFFGAEGWTFSRPGKYVIEADYPEGTASPTPGGDPGPGRIRAVALEIEMVEPTTSADRTARSLVLDPRKGLFLFLGGGDHLTETAAQLREMARVNPTATQMAGVKLALGGAALDPTVDPKTGVESTPRLEEAKAYLRPTMDSQLPALTVAEAQVELVQKLDQAGRSQEAAQVRQSVIRKFRNQEAASAPLAEIRKASPPQ